MACTITITSPVTGIGSPSPTVTVHGTATECAEVEVRLTCGVAAPVTRTTTATVTGDAWTAIFDDTNCPCGGPVNIEVRCLADPACTTTATLTLECPCPTATVTVTPGGCNAAGERGVSFTVSLSGAGPFNSQVEYIAGSGIASLTMMTSTYTVGPYFYPEPRHRSALTRTAAHGRKDQIWTTGWG